jgi:hypothetical protein
MDAFRFLSAVSAMVAIVAATVAATAQTSQGTIVKIKERGKLLAGVKLDTPPFGFLDDKNEPAGFDIDLVRKVGARIGVPVELVKVTSPTPDSHAGQWQCGSCRRVDDAHARTRSSHRFQHYLLHRRPVLAGGQGQHD